MYCRSSRRLPEQAHKGVKLFVCRRCLGTRRLSSLSSLPLLSTEGPLATVQQLQSAQQCSWELACHPGLSSSMMDIPVHFLCEESIILSPWPLLLIPSGFITWPFLTCILFATTLQGHPGEDETGLALPTMFAIDLICMQMILEGSAREGRDSYLCAFLHTPQPTCHLIVFVLIGLPPAGVAMATFLGVLQFVIHFPASIACKQRSL